jgi:hypothetical protein
MQMLRSRALAGALATVLLVVGGYAGYRVWRHAQNAAPRPAPAAQLVLGAPVPTPAAEAAAFPTPIPTATPLPTSVFVKVPYTAQSPYNKWGAGNPHEEYCEAAATLMVGQYFRGDTRAAIPPAEADAAMARIVSVERQTFPGVLDLPLTSIAAIGTQLYGLHPTVAPVDLNQIEHSLASGQPVIIPVMTHGAAGQKISPHYGSVNVYHVILLTGYDNARGLLYANDAGFVEGQNTAYTWSVLSSAIDAQAARYPQGRVMLTFQAVA